MQLLNPVGAAADQAIGPQQAPGDGGGQVVLTEVHPIGIHGQGQIKAVVDKEQGAMAGAELAQGPSFAEPLLVADRQASRPWGVRLRPVLNETHARLQGCGHHRLQVGDRAGDQIQLALLQQLSPPAGAGSGPQHVHLQVVEAIADGGRFACQGTGQPPAEFLQNPEGLLDPAAIRRHHGSGPLALGLGPMGHARSRIGGRVTGQLEAGLVATAQALAEILGAAHQVGAFQAKTAPVFNHPQAFAGPVEVGIQQAFDRPLLPGPSRAGLRFGAEGLRGWTGNAGTGQRGRNHGDQ